MGVAVITSTSVASTLVAEAHALLDAEAVLLVDHREAEVAELHALLEQRMGADDERASSHRRGPATPRAARPRRTEPVSSPTVTGDKRRKGAEMLLDQKLRGRHQRRLRAGLGGAQHRQQRHQRLARADIALQQPQHGPRRRHVSVDLRPARGSARASAGSRNAQRLGPQMPVALERAARARPCAQRGAARARPARPATRHRRGGCARPPAPHRRVRRLHPAKRGGEAGPAPPRRAGRLDPFGKLRQAGEGARHGAAHEPVGDAGRQRPDRLDLRHLSRALDRQHVIWMRQRQLVGEALQLARHDELGADRHLASRA